MKQIRLSIIKVFQITMTLFFIMGLYLAYIMVVKSADYMDNPNNPRTAENIMLRGTIYDRAGRILAVSKKDNEYSSRFYPLKELGEPMLGYLSHMYGKGSLEFVLDEYLTAPLVSSQFIEYILKIKPRGQDIYLTIDEELQKASSQLLKDKKGGIAAINPANGEILALASSPSFDPAKLDTQWNSFTSSPDSPFLLRPVNGFYPPGSVFKLLTYAACIEEKLITNDTSFYCGGSYPIEYSQGTYFIRDAGGQAHGGLSAADALVHSCNIVFAQMGLKLGKYRFLEYLDKFGLLENPDFPLMEMKNLLPARDELTDTQLAQSAFGQGEISVSPLSIALMASAIANEGKIMKPSIIKARTNHKGQTLYKNEPEVWKTPIGVDTARLVKQVMIETVERGTGYNARIEGLKIAGKTGSAENPMGETHAWFVCFAPADNPEILLVIIIENAGAGGKAAAPLAKELLQIFNKKKEKSIL